MPRWSTPGAAAVLRDLIVPALRDVIIPGGGLVAMLTDKPLTPLAAGAYLVMMGLPVAGVVDRLREKRNGDQAAPTVPPLPPSPDPPARPS